MTERNRHEQSKGQQSSDGPGVPEMADDRGRNRNRRSFSGDREYDELGSEIDLDFTSDDDMSMDDGLGGPGRNQ